MDARVYNLPTECVIILFGGTNDAPGWALVPGDGIIPIPGWDPDGWKEVSACLAAATSLATQVPDVANTSIRQRMSEFVLELHRVAAERVDKIIAGREKAVLRE